MSLDGSFEDGLPEYVPTTSIRVEDEIEFESPSNHRRRVVYPHDRAYGSGLYGSGLYGSNAYISSTAYRLRKAPFEGLRTITAMVGGVQRELEHGTDVRPVDTTGDGVFDAIEFIESGTLPDTGTTVTVEYVAESIASRYTGAFDADMDTFGERITEASESKSVSSAEGRSLSLVGSQFGEIGQRRNRSDDEYRRFLRSVVSAYSGRGTKDDVKFAVAAATGGDPENVRIEENTDVVGFEVYIEDFGQVEYTSSLEELVDIASPSGVELLRPPVMEVVGGGAVAGGTPSTVTTNETLGSTTLGDSELGN